MSFEFNFPNPEEEEEEEEEDDDDQRRAQGDGTEESVSERKDSQTATDEDEAVSIEVKIEKSHQIKCCQFNCEAKTVTYEIGEDLQIKSLDTKSVEEQLKKQFEDQHTNSAVHEALVSKNDLIPDKYEGGLQIWECSIDLAKFVSTKDFTSKMVAELGCGGGLPGLCALKKGAHFILFQDFNDEVLSNLTIPNVLLNCEDKKERCAFFSGDWKNLPQALRKSGSVAQKYDVILTAETIYNAKNYCKLLDLMDFLLEKDGDVYVAAKNYYFGVGGSTREFLMKVAEDKRFISSICWAQSDGVCREILRLQRKKR